MNKTLTIAELTCAEVNRLIELHIFGDDLSCFDKDGSERYGRKINAIRQFFKSGLSLETMESMCKVWNPMPQDFANDGIPIRIYGDSGYRAMWDLRHGQPWQADLEKYVHEYRADPRNWCGHIELAMGELWPWLVERVHVELFGEPRKSCVCNVFTLGDINWTDTPRYGITWTSQAISNTPAEAIARAALAVAMMEE